MSKPKTHNLLTHSNFSYQYETIIVLFSVTVTILENTERQAGSTAPYFKIF